MNRKDLTKTFMMISNEKKCFGLHGLYEKDPTLWQQMINVLCMLSS